MRILLISIIPPHPTNRGGNQRTCLLYRAISEIAEIDLVCLYPPERLSAEERRELEQQFRLVMFHAPIEPSDRFPWYLIAKAGFTSIASRLAHNIVPQSWNYLPDPTASKFINKLLESNPYDAVVCRYSRSLALAGLPNTIPCLLDVDDLDTQKYESRLESNTQSMLAKLFIKRHINNLEKIIPPILQRAQHLWVTNEEDIFALQKLGASHASVLPNIPFPSTSSNTNQTCENTEPAALPQNDLNHSHSVIVLAVCSMRMSFNERGIDNFVHRIWPQIISSVPNAKFHIVGSMMNNEQIRRWSLVDGVVALGTVDNLEQEYDKAAFTITPVSEGGGSKIKIAESLSFGKTCVITEHALRGYETLLKHEECLLVANTDEDFAQHCIRLLIEPDTRQTMAEYGKNIVKSNLSEASFRKIVQSDLRRVLS